MKNSLLYSICLAGLTAASCSQDDTTGSASPRNISVNVSDIGLLNGATGTRATTSGVTTTFDNGDEIGIYAVSNGQVVDGYDNLKLTKTADGWDGFPTNATFANDTKFYAYYPYTASPSFTAEDTFTALINAWNPASAQSYTLGDLMTTPTPASLTVVDDLTATISLQLSHAMSMIEVTVKNGNTITYKFSNEGMTDYTVTTGSSAPSFTLGNTTITSVGQTCSNTYRLLINPSSKQTLYITVDGKNYTPKEALSLKAGNYYTMSVGEGGGTTEQTHTLQVGDYYLSDGRIVSKEATLTADEKSKVIAIVYYVGNPTPTALYSSSYSPYTDALKIDHPECVHGLAYAVDGLTMDGGWGTEMATDGFFNLYKQNKGILAECSSTNAGSTNHRILGYDNTATFNYLNKSDGTTYALLLRQLAAKTDAPIVSSGWFIPSYGDIYEIVSDAKATAISNAFTALGKTLWDGTVYMTSTPSFDSKKLYSGKIYGYDGSGFSTYTLERTPHILRPSLAF